MNLSRSPRDLTHSLPRQCMNSFFRVTTRAASNLTKLSTTRLLTCLTSTSTRHRYRPTPGMPPDFKNARDQSGRIAPKVFSFHCRPKTPTRLITRMQVDSTHFPPFLQHRIDIFDRLLAEHEQTLSCKLVPREFQILN